MQMPNQRSHLGLAALVGEHVLQHRQWRGTTLPVLVPLQQALAYNNGAQTLGFNNGTSEPQEPWELQET